MLESKDGMRTTLGPCVDNCSLRLEFTSSCCTRRPPYPQVYDKCVFLEMKKTGTGDFWNRRRLCVGSKSHVTSDCGWVLIISVCDRRVCCVVFFVRVIA